MAQIIQYKERIKDSSVYPVTVGSAVYMNVGDTSILDTLDNVIRTKIEAVNVLIDTSIDTIAYPYVPTTPDTSLSPEQKENAIKNLGLDELSQKVDMMVTNLSNKQDKLQHGPDGNIKRINGANILGPGEVNIFAIEKDWVPVDDTLSTESDNPVENKAITAKFNEVNDKIDNIIETVMEELNNPDSWWDYGDEE